MENKELLHRFPFKIVDLKTNSFSEQNLSEEEIQDFDPNLVEFNIQPGFGFNKKLNLIKVNFLITYLYKKKEILKIDVDTVFEFVKQDDLDLENKTILATVLGVSFSTIRGIILNRTIGSFMNKIYLPIINPTEIIEDMANPKK
ncbi:hypothetical protein ACT3CE_00235 [Marinifilum sp. RC60d5]|uniref:hypothetical protein n=1 Tax=Marinifilum sp. RC60d5 TaxID=3458414 RepID=UPI004035362C